MWVVKRGQGARLGSTARRYASGEYYGRLAPVTFSHVRKHADLFSVGRLRSLEKHLYVFALRYQPNQASSTEHLARLSSKRRNRRRWTENIFSLLSAFRKLHADIFFLKIIHLKYTQNVHN